MRPDRELDLIVLLQLLLFLSVVGGIAYVCAAFPMEIIAFLTGL